jgi:hypothetical protein
MLQSTVWMPASARTASNAAVKFKPPVADHETDSMRLIAELHDQVACLLAAPNWQGSVAVGGLRTPASRSHYLAAGLGSRWLQRTVTARR